MIPALPVAPDYAHGVIPARLHRIWVGGPVPYWVAKSWDRWEDFLDQSSSFEWATYEWTEKSVEGTFLEKAVKAGRDYDLPPRGVADLMRVLAVGLYGGWYMDADVVPLRSLDDLTEQPGIHGWTCSHPASRTQKVLWNGGFGFSPNHPYMAKIMASAVFGLERGVRNEHFLAGPRAYRAFLKDDILTEWDFDFPASASERRTMGAGGDFDYEELRAKYPARLKHIGPTFEEAS